MNTLCQAKHKKHDRLLVDTQQGEMYVYDYDQYNGFNGYCTGQDDISRTLQNTGVWEPIETAIIKEILENGDRNASVIDFGTHIGWFTLMAAEAGYKVIGYEGMDDADIAAIDLGSVVLLQKSSNLFDDIYSQSAGVVQIEFESWHH